MTRLPTRPWAATSGTNSSARASSDEPRPLLCQDPRHHAPPPRRPRRSGTRAPSSPAPAPPAALRARARVIAGTAGALRACACLFMSSSSSSAEDGAVQRVRPAAPPSSATTRGSAPPLATSSRRTRSSVSERECLSGAEAPPHCVRREKREPGALVRRYASAHRCTGAPAHCHAHSRGAGTSRRYVRQRREWLGDDEGLRTKDEGARLVLCPLVVRPLLTSPPPPTPSAPSPSG